MTIFGQRRMVAPADLGSPYTGGVVRRDLPVMDRTLQVFLPEVYPIPSSQDFNPVVSKATSAVEANVDTGLSVQVPANNVAVIRGVSIYITNMVATTNVTWTLRLNGVPVAGYSGISIFPRVAPYVGNTFDAMLRVPAGAAIAVTYSNNDGGTYTIGASVTGWWWPQELGRTWLSQGPG